MHHPEQFDRWRHRFCVFLVFAVLVLISAGALVTSKEAGLSVPDWPLSYGSLNPPRWWQIENVRAEHGHRLIAGSVALLTVICTVWTLRRESRSWVRRLAVLATITVFVQALLGGITVLYFLPTPISVSHAGLAELFLGLTVALALVTSRWWLEVSASDADVVPVRSAATLLSVAVYLQILIGAVMRHSGAGLAIPDFPLAFGGLLPDRWSFAIGIHFAHRLGALVVVVIMVVVFVLVRRRASGRLLLLLPSSLLLVLGAWQVGLGAAVVLTAKAVVPNTVHVATGATIWATSLLLTLASWRLAGSRGAVARRQQRLHEAAA